MEIIVLEVDTNSQFNILEIESSDMFYSNVEESILFSKLPKTSIKLSF